jgi:hypothetical protein
MNFNKKISLALGFLIISIALVLYSPKNVMGTADVIDVTDNTATTTVLGLNKIDLVTFFLMNNHFIEGLNLYDRFNGDVASATTSDAMPTLVEGGTIERNYLSFDGIDDTLSIPYDADKEASPPITIIARVKRQNVIEQFPIMNTRSGSGGFGFSIAVTDKIKITYFGVGNANSTLTITDTDWHCIAIVDSGLAANNVQFWIDNVDAGTDTLAAPGNSGKERYMSVSLLTNGVINEYFPGNIAWYARYNKVMNQNEIDAVCKAANGFNFVN